MLWLKRLNFVETAKLEMELMKAFEAGEDLDAKLDAQAQLAGGGATRKRPGSWRCGKKCWCASARCRR